MSRKVYIKPPAPTRTMLIAQIILLVLFVPLGLSFVFIADGDARPFAGFFALIWVVACVAMIVHSVKLLNLVESGKIEIAEFDDTTAEPEANITDRLRSLESLKKEHLISENEYQEKRREIMKEKW